MLNEKIGCVWDDVTEMQGDLECELSGIVHFGEAQFVPYSSLKRMEVYNEPSEFDDEENFEEENYALEFAEVDGEVKLINVY